VTRASGQTASEQTKAERARTRRQLQLMCAAWLLAAPVLWVLGAPRYALASFLGGVICAVFLGGPKEQRIPSGRTEPTTVPSSVVYLVGIGGFAAIAVVMVPYPRVASAAAIWAVAITVAWVWTRRWPRGHPPLVS
jgi:hypothetical protein